MDVDVDVVVVMVVVVGCHGCCGCCVLLWLWLWCGRGVHEMSRSISHHEQAPKSGDNAWESDSRRPRHSRALDNQQLLAEGSKKVRSQPRLNVPMDGVPKTPSKKGEKPTAANRLTSSMT